MRSHSSHRLDAFCFICIPFFFFFFFPSLLMPYHKLPPFPSPRCFKSIYFALGTVRGCYTLCKGKRLVQVSKKKKGKKPIPPVRALCRTVKLKVTELFAVSQMSRSFLTRCVSVFVRMCTLWALKLTVLPPH